MLLLLWSERCSFPPSLPLSPSATLSHLPQPSLAFPAPQSTLRTGSPLSLRTAYLIDNYALLTVTIIWSALNFWFIQRAVFSYLGAPRHLGVTNVTVMSRQ